MWGELIPGSEVGEQEKDKASWKEDQRAERAGRGMEKQTGGR